MSKPKLKRPAAKPFDLADAKFIYASLCHNAVAKKPALRMPSGHIGRAVGAVPDTDSQTEGLGGWRCTECGKPCKVSRSVNPELKPKSRSIVGGK